MSVKEARFKNSLNLLIIFLILIIAVNIMGYVYYQNQKYHITKEKQNELLAIADLKVAQIVNWRNERLSDLSFISDNPLVISQLHQWLLDPKKNRLREEILAWMRSLHRNFSYDRVIITDSGESTRLLIPEGQEVLGPNDKRLIAEVIKSGRTIFSDLYKSRREKATRLSLVAPIIVSGGQNKGLADGAFLLRINPYAFLYPLVQSWPTPSPTAETTLVRREGNEVLFLNELRHQKNTALALRYPVKEKNLVAAMAGRGVVGIAEGVDYRGVRVLAAIKPVPESTWIVISKVDAEEVYAPIRERFWIVVVLGGVLLVAAGVSVGLVWRDQQARTYSREISERKQAEEKLSLAMEELSRSNDELEKFAYVASHDLQEPLRMISSFVQLLEKRYKGKLDQDADDFINFAVDGANRMQTLITDLLAYSRVGTRGKKFVETSCEAVLDRALSNLQAVVEETGAVVTRDPLPAVTGDDSQLVQLFQNLIGNAIKFCKGSVPRIHISVEQSGDDWVFSVRDNGIGIAPEYCERIFSIFQRLHGRQEYPGTGIGLAICRKVVERHGGKIWVKSVLGTGSTFYFTIPVQKEIKS